MKSNSTPFFSYFSPEHLQLSGKQMQVGKIYRHYSQTGSYEFNIRLAGMEKVIYQLKFVNAAAQLTQTTTTTITQQEQAILVPMVISYPDRM